MKTAQDPRHQLRREVVKTLFAESFTHQEKASELVKKILGQRGLIDKKITKAAPDWSIDKINKVDIAILRLAVFELIENTVPPKVVIDEAVELAKEYGAESSSSFVNGVLATIYKQRDGTN